MSWIAIFNPCKQADNLYSGLTSEYSHPTPTDDECENTIRKSVGVGESCRQTVIALSIIKDMEYIVSNGKYLEIS